MQVDRDAYQWHRTGQGCDAVGTGPFAVIEVAGRHLRWGGADEAVAGSGDELRRALSAALAEEREWESRCGGEARLLVILDRSASAEDWAVALSIRPSDLRFMDLLVTADSATPGDLRGSDEGKLTAVIDRGERRLLSSPGGKEIEWGEVPPELGSCVHLVARPHRTMLDVAREVALFRDNGANRVALSVGSAPRSDQSEPHLTAEVKDGISVALPQAVRVLPMYLPPAHVLDGGVECGSSPFHSVPNLPCVCLL